MMDRRISRNVKFLALAASLIALLALAACSVNVHKDGDEDSKKVDIETPVGGIHVSKDADAREIGVPVYPGARLKEKEGDGEEKSANVNISSGLFGLKVVAIEYQSDDAPEKVIAYYKDQLKKYGNVLECHTEWRGKSVTMHHDSGHSKELKCEGDGSGKAVELKVGTEDNQHVVAVKPEDKGCSFALVFVRAHGNDTI